MRTATTIEGSGGNYPAGDTLAARLDNLARAIELVHSLGS
jgi:hypothetical protein